MFLLCSNIDTTGLSKQVWQRTVTAPLALQEAQQPDLQNVLCSQCTSMTATFVHMALLFGPIQSISEEYMYICYALQVLTRSIYENDLLRISSYVVIIDVCIRILQLSYAMDACNNWLEYKNTNTSTHCVSWPTKNLSTKVYISNIIKIMSRQDHQGWPSLKLMESFWTYSLSHLPNLCLFKYLNLLPYFFEISEILPPLKYCSIFLPAHPNKCCPGNLATW